MSASLFVFDWNLRAWALGAYLELDRSMGQYGLVIAIGPLTLGFGYFPK